jgi:hypothetical protein
MRITISHKLGRNEAVRRVTSAADTILRPDLPGPVRLSEVTKSWTGDKLNFSLNAVMGPVRVPIVGYIEVRDAEITVDADLGILNNLIPEGNFKTGLETKLRGLLQ